MAIVRLHLAGRSLRDIEREFGCDRKEAADWVRRFKKYGADGLARKTNIRATYELKVKMVKDNLEKGVSITELCQKHNVSRSTLKKWISVVRKSGYEALRGLKRGRPANSERSPRPVPLKKPQTEVRVDLLSENDYLKNELSRVKSLLQAVVMENK